MKQFIFIFLFAIYTLKCFQYVNWNPTYAGWASYFIFGSLFIYVCNHHKVLHRQISPISKLIPWLMGLPMLCLIQRVLVQGVPLYEEKALIFSVLAFSIFYYYQIKQISEQSIIKLITLIGLCIFVIQVYQQIFPEKAMFGVNATSDNSYAYYGIAEIRNGLYRFRIGGSFFVLFCLYYYWTRFCERTSLKNFLFFIIFFTSMYLFLTRQIMFASIVTLACSFLFIKNVRLKIWISILFCIVGGLLIVYSDLLFGELFNQTKNDVNEDNIRVLAFTFLGDRIIDTFITFLFGNGYPSELLTKWADVLHIFPSDVGIIGAMYHHGFLWIVYYFYILYLLLIRYRHKLPLYIKLFVFGTSINSILVFPYRSTNEYFLWATILYLCSLYIHGKSQIR